MTTPKSTKPKLLVILGPTACGKSDLAVELALKLNGEVVSADSRQVYKGLDIGTGKITLAEMKGVPHHCLDIANPNERFTAMDWKKAAEAAVSDIISRGKLPIICGGTGFYISALIDDLGFPDVESDTEEQKALESKTAEELFDELVKLDPERAKTIDMKNKRRLSRAILVARALGSVPALIRPSEPKYDAVMIGVLVPDQTLRERIMKRLVARLDAGMVKEIEGLHVAGLSYERMDELGLEYRYVSQFLEGRIAYPDMVKLLATRICQYAKRQRTWFKKDARIRWMSQPVDVAEVAKLVQ